MIMQTFFSELRMALNEKSPTFVRLLVIPLGFEPSEIKHLLSIY